MQEIVRSGELVTLHGRARCLPTTVQYGTASHFESLRQTLGLSWSPSDRASLTSVAPYSVACVHRARPDPIKRCRCSAGARWSRTPREFHQLKPSVDETWARTRYWLARLVSSSICVRPWTPKTPMRNPQHAPRPHRAVIVGYSPRWSDLRPSLAFGSIADRWPDIRPIQNNAASARGSPGKRPNSEFECMSSVPT